MHDPDYPIDESIREVYMRQLSLFFVGLLLVGALITAPGCSKSAVDAYVSSSCTLSNLSVSDGIELSPAFSAGVTDYSASVPQDFAKCTVTAYAGHDS